MWLLKPDVVLSVSLNFSRMTKWFEKVSKIVLEAICRARLGTLKERCSSKVMKNGGPADEWMTLKNGCCCCDKNSRLYEPPEFWVINTPPSWEKCETFLSFANIYFIALMIVAPHTSSLLPKEVILSALREIRSLEFREFELTTESPLRVKALFQFFSSVHANKANQR